MPVYPAISIYQPWCGLIPLGVKVDETRPVPPPVKHIGQRVAIQAACRRPTAAELVSLERAALMWQSPRQAMARDFLRSAFRDPCFLPFGAVLCTAVLAGGYQCAAGKVAGGVGIASAVPGSMNREFVPTDPFGNFEPGRWAWWLTQITPLPVPSPAKGKQGWWRWDSSDAPA